MKFWTSKWYPGKTPLFTMKRNGTWVGFIPCNTSAADIASSRGFSDSGYAETGDGHALELMLLGAVIRTPIERHAFPIALPIPIRLPRSRSTPSPSVAEEDYDRLRDEDFESYEP